MITGLNELFWQAPENLSSINYSLMFGVDCEFRVWASTGQTLNDAQNHNWDGEVANNITDLPSTSVQSENWIRFKILTPNFIDAGLKLLYTSSNSDTPVELEVNVNSIDKDFLIPINKDVTDFNITPSVGDVYVEIRNDSPNNTDYTQWPLTVYDLAQKATLLASINSIYAIDPNAQIALHIWATSRPCTVDFEMTFTDGSKYNDHINYNQNLKYPESLEGRDQEFDGINDYNALTINTLQKDVEQLFVFTFNYASTGGGQTLLGGTRDNSNNLPHYQFSIRPDGTTTFLMRKNWAGGLTSQNQWIGNIALNDGYNCAIVHYKGYAGVNDIDFYINGLKDNLSFNQVNGGILAGDSFAVSKDYIVGRITDNYQIPSNLTGSYFNGKLKILQWINASSITVNSSLIREIYNEKSAREIIDNSNYLLDFEATDTNPTDISPNTYTLTPFGGYVSNPEFLDF